MAIKDVEKLEDKLVVHYRLQKPWGIKDEEGTREIIYKSIEKLRSLPKVFEGSSIPVTRVIEDISVPELGKIISFVFESYSEKSAGPPEEGLEGVYCRRNNQGPEAFNVF